MNNIHLINTLQQENQDFSQEISTLKMRLHGVLNLLKEINDKFTKINELNRGDMNNILLINTLRQENLPQEISMLKMQFREETDVRKGITEERNSRYQEALQILTKERSTLKADQGDDTQITHQELQQQQQSHTVPTEANRVLDFIPISQSRFQAKF